MATIIKLYYYLNLAVGLTNLHYDSKTQALQLNHWITIALWAVLSTAALVVQPIGLVAYYKVSYYCKEFGPLIVMNGLLTISHILATVVTTLETWLKRKRFQQLCYNFGILIRHYLADSKRNENHEATKRARAIMLVKVFSSFCKTAGLYIHLYNRVNIDKCQVPIMPQTSLIALSIYYGFLNLALVIVDINATLGLCLIDVNLRILLDDLNKIKRDIKLLNTAYKRRRGERQRQIHELWRLKLSRDVDNIAREETKLRSMTMEHIKIHQGPLLFILLTVFLSLISLLFHVLSSIASGIGNIEFTLLFILFVLVANAINTMMLFNICESLRGNILKMGYEVHKMRVYASLVNRNIFHGDQLELSLERLMMQIRYQEFKITICGLFEIQNRTGIVMLGSTVLNLIYLIQSVIQIYLKNYEKNQL